MRLAFRAMPPESILWTTVHYSGENEIVQGTKQELYFKKMIHIYHINCVENVKESTKIPNTTMQK